MYRRAIKYFTVTIAVLLFFIQYSYCNTRIKDIAAIEGVRDNILVGYGLVVGLNGTGDNLNNAVFTQQGLTDFLERLGVNIQGSNLKTKNIAAAVVTANLNPFANQGSRIDVQVSTLGDAKSLRGGTLLATPLLAANGDVYAVAQGAIAVSDFTPISSDVKNKWMGVETTGYIQNGAIVENEIDFRFRDLKHIKFSLYSPDFSTAIAIAESINNHIPGNTAIAIDAGTVQVTVPEYRKDDVIEFVASIEKLTVVPDYKAKIVINEATGTIVIGDKVNVRPVAIAQGNLVVNVGQLEYDNISPFMKEEKQNALNKFVDSKRGRSVHELQGANLSELVSGLNKLGVHPRDIINILYNMKSVGALDAVIEVK